MLNTLENLIKLAKERKLAPVEGSYTNKLLIDKSLSKAKVLEEINELIEAVEENTNKIPESSDMQILLVFSEKYFALRSEFCLNVVPVSIGLDILKSKFE